MSYSHVKNLAITGKLAVGNRDFEMDILNSSGNLMLEQWGAGVAYYVDVNAGADANNGLSWSTAFKTYAVAVAANNANIASGLSGYAARNRLYYKGDNNEAAAETITTLPNKCDVIGVGSYDHRPMPFMIGNHVVGAGAYMGTRFINMGFLSPAAGGAIFTVPTTTSGLAFIGCMFDGRSATAATIGVSLTGVEQASIIGCRFVGKFSTEAIYIGTGSGRMLMISDNFIESGAIGIAVHASFTTADCAAWIVRNYFDVVTIVVDDDSSKITISGNRGRTASAGTNALTWSWNVKLASDNIISNDATTSVYPVLAAIPT
jgi:hypothetical protein